MQVVIKQPVQMIARGYGRSGDLDVLFGAHRMCVLAKTLVFGSAAKHRIPRIEKRVAILSAYDNDLVKAPEIVGTGSISVRTALLLDSKRFCWCIATSTLTATVGRKIAYTRSFWKYIRGSGPSKHPKYYFDSLSTKDAELPGHSMKGYNAARARLAKVRKATGIKVGLHLRDLIYDERRLCWTPVDLGSLPGVPEGMVKKRKSVPKMGR